MASNLYEILSVARDASPEQIRKAYKAKALKTHPDRLPPGATAADKAASEEQFRRVNNAYEILSDPQNRRVYDLHGVWPPPEPLAPRAHRHPHHQYPSAHRGRTFYEDPFSQPLFTSFDNDPFTSGFASRSRPYPSSRDFPRFPPAFEFTDPFRLFESIFGHLDALESAFESAFPDPVPVRRHRSVGGPIDYFGGVGGYGPPAHVFQQSQMFAGLGGGHDGRWAAEQRVIKTINGVTESVWTRRDYNGNEHVTRTYPDGRERYTINGVEQNTVLPPPPPYPGSTSSGPVLSPPPVEFTPPPHLRREESYSPVYDDRDRDREREWEREREWDGGHHSSTKGRWRRQ